MAVSEVVSRWQPLPSVALEPASHALRQFQLSRHQTTHTANISRTTSATRDADSFHAGDGRRRSTQSEREGCRGVWSKQLVEEDEATPVPPTPPCAATTTTSSPRRLPLNKCRIRSAAHSPARCACAENKGRRAARRCQAQASIEKRVAAAPKSRPSYHRPPSASPASRKSPKSQLCPPANPPPGSDSPLSAARVTLRARRSPRCALNTSFY